MTPRSRKPAAPRPSRGALGDARHRLIATADRLFYQEGARAVGIDRVLAESGVAKMSLYRHFRSKDELIAACLEQRNEDYWKWFDGVVAEHPGDPREQLRALFRAMAERSAKPGYHGCPFLNTAHDFIAPENPAHKVSVRHKATLLSRLTNICKKIGAKDPESLARQFVLLINGAQSTAGMLGQRTQFALVEAGERLLGQSQD